MKIFLLPLLFFGLNSFGQSFIGSVNSGAVSDNGMIYSAGEIFVIPSTDPNKANSGMAGIASRIEFLVLGLNDMIKSDDARAYPNPTSKSLYVEVKSNTQVRQISIYDMSGRFILSKDISNNAIDLSSLVAGEYLVKTNIETIAPFKITKQ